MVTQSWCHVMKCRAGSIGEQDLPSPSEKPIESLISELSYIRDVLMRHAVDEEIIQQVFKQVGFKNLSRLQRPPVISFGCRIAWEFRGCPCHLWAPFLGWIHFTLHREAWNAIFLYTFCRHRHQLLASLTINHRDCHFSWHFIDIAVLSFGAFSCFISYALGRWIICFYAKTCAIGTRRCKYASIFQVWSSGVANN